MSENIKSDFGKERQKENGWKIKTKVKYREKEVIKNIKTGRIISNHKLYYQMFLIYKENIKKTKMDNLAKKKDK